jgi:hypothetical protein
MPTLDAQLEMVATIAGQTVLHGAKFTERVIVMVAEEVDTRHLLPQLVRTILTEVVVVAIAIQDMLNL